MTLKTVSIEKGTKGREELFQKMAAEHRDDLGAEVVKADRNTFYCVASARRRELDKKASEATTMFFRGLLTANDKKFELALKMFDDSKGIYGQAMNGWFGLAGAYLARNDLAEARHAFEIGMDVSTNLADAIEAKAVVLDRMEKKDESEKVLNAADEVRKGNFAQC